MVPFPTLFPASRSTPAGPKHSTSVPSRTGSAVALSVDVKGPVLPPNPLSGVAVKGWLAPIGIQIIAPVDIGDRVHRVLLLFTLH